ncbi:hypothetical protein [Pseudokordiimonas caeni]|uniref:hypothetical protein n=1 Tax=Pseudokordiimonas caeni TaxID=2997908 RepID=UPI002810B8C9|nr:hypothetical protein [Pseudokordiimonas caeni]
MGDKLSDLGRQMRLNAAGKKLASGDMADAFAEYLALAREGYAPAQHVTALCLGSEDMPDEALGEEAEDWDREVEAAAWDCLSVRNGFDGAGLIFKQAALDPEWHAAMEVRIDELATEFPDALQENKA